MSTPTLSLGDGSTVSYLGVQSTNGGVALGAVEQLGLSFGIQTFKGLDKTKDVSPISTMPRALNGGGLEIRLEELRTMTGLHDSSFHYRQSPLWMKILSVFVILLLLFGIIGTFIMPSLFTSALVPIGFTLWAVLAGSIRWYDSRA